MMNIDYSEQLLLSELFSSSKKRLQSYTLLNRLGLQEATFFKLIVRLKDKQLIEFHDIYLELTPLGIDTLIHQQYTKKIKSEIPDDFKNPYRVKVNSFYTPKKRLIF
ncbi:hypothetical protein [Acinetobacter pittii]|uniref:hypothetical protein n=1 Tax=Acinetobacter pittii TaxID=48296 RepID=UPI001F06CE2E|nr:hypothetical protein [Acinetobacter pittii]MCH2053771.1 hypothetical protein [Acinetobacter pittii]